MNLNSDIATMTREQLEAELRLARKVFWLAVNDHVFLASYSEEKRDWDDDAHMAINLNDLFVPGADAHGVPDDQVDDLIEVCRRWPKWGDVAYATVRMGGDPTPWRRGIPEFDKTVAEVREFLAALANLPKSSSSEKFSEEKP